MPLYPRKPVLNARKFLVTLTFPNRFGRLLLTFSPTKCQQDDGFTPPTKPTCCETTSIVVPLTNCVYVSVMKTVLRTFGSHSSQNLSENPTCTVTSPGCRVRTIAVSAVENALPPQNCKHPKKPQARRPHHYPPPYDSRLGCRT